MKCLELVIINIGLNRQFIFSSYCDPRIDFPMREKLLCGTYIPKNLLL